MCTGFSLKVGKKEVFIETSKTRKTEIFARQIARELLIPDSPGVISEIIYWLVPVQFRRSGGFCYYLSAKPRVGGSVSEDDCIFLKI